jgi:hypothetical protein
MIRLTNIQTRGIHWENIPESKIQRIGITYHYIVIGAEKVPTGVICLTIRELWEMIEKAEYCLYARTVGRNSV